MAVAKLRLSARERKVLMKASQQVYREFSGWESKFADDLCNKLDDGGIWNPCTIQVSKTAGETVTYDSFYGLVLVIKHGKDTNEEYQHMLRMIKGRLSYTESGNRPRRKRKVPAFLTRSDYYGPNWEEQREKAISRDEHECRECGVSRKMHKEKYNHDLHVHHIKPLREIGDYTEANTLKNLKALCAPCHRKS